MNMGYYFCRTIRFAGFVIVMVWLGMWAVPEASAQPSFRISTIDSADIGPIPKITWLYDIDAADGYIATVQKEAGLFQLWGRGGEVFSRKPDDGWIFYFVRIQPSAHILLVSEAHGEFSIRWIGYDYSGRVVLGPINTSQSLRVSPNGKICYGVFEIGEDISKPVLYDSAGNHLVTFHPRPEIWDIKILSDSTLLYRHPDTIRIISYPEIDTISEFIVPFTDQSHNRVRSAVSGDGSYYAYVGRGTIIICNVHNGEISLAPDEIADKYSDRHPALSDDGEFLIMNHSPRGVEQVSIYRKSGRQYAAVADTFVVPLPGEYAFWGYTILMNRYCALSYQTRLATGLIFKSFLFDFTAPPDEGIKGELLDGLVTIDSNNDDPSRFRLTSTDSGYARTKLCRIDNLR